MLSIVVPAYDEAENLRPFLARLRTCLDGLPLERSAIEVIIVSDGSRDDTYAVACGEVGHGTDLPGTVVELVRNAGSAAATRCGMAHAQGEFIALLSADGQDPPELLGEMLGRFDDDVDLVWGQRSSRRNDTRMTRISSGAFYRVFRAISRMDYPPSGLDFAVMRRSVADAVLARSGHNAALALSLYNVTPRQTFVPYERGERLHGESKWTYRRRFKLAFDMVAASSAAPMRVASGLGFLVSLLILGWSAVGLVGGGGPESAGLVALVGTLGCLAFASLALVGEYVWRVSEQLRNPPLYVEGRHHGGTDARTLPVVDLRVSPARTESGLG